MGSAADVMPDPEVSGSAVGNAGAAVPLMRSGEIWVPPGHGRINQLERLKSLPDVQVKLCDPAINPDAPAYFVVNFCRTIDERRQIRTLTANGFFLNYLRTLERGRLEEKNVLGDKPRQMRITWGGVAYFLWNMVELEGFTGFMTTRKDDLVDDGGEHSSFKSMFGRLRFMWERLPSHLRKAIIFTHMKAVCEEMMSSCFGEAPTEDAGRSFNVSRALVDEFAKLRYDALTLASVAPMCPNGKILQSTQDGPDTEFARIQEEILAGELDNWILFSVDWRDDHEKRCSGPSDLSGLRPTTEEQAEKLGAETSDWFDKATQGLTGDVIASEFLKSKEKSKKGVIYKGFSKDVHVARQPIAYNPDLDLILGLDYGSTGFSAAAIGQPIGDSELRIIGEYELAGAGGAPKHAENIWALLRRLGYEGAIRDIELVGGPDTDSQQTGSGQTIAGYYRDFGFAKIQQCRVRGPGSIDRRIAVVEVALARRRILISPTCKTIIARVPQYRWPVNRVTGRIGGVKPAPSDANHMMDAFGYLACEVFPEEKGGVVVSQPEIRKAQVSDDQMTQSQYEPSVFLDQDRGPGLGTIAPPVDTRY